MLVAYRIIAVLLIAIVIVLLAGSLYAIIRGPDSGPLFRIGGSGGNRSGQILDDGSVGIFSGIGIRRIPLAGEPPAVIVLSISFSYPADDRPFAEELASRIGDFRSIADSYFSSLPREKTAPLDEEAAKAEILRRYNALLRLGKIEALYFGDLMVLE
jgi:flagellar basal body-associated protein FliL